MSVPLSLLVFFSLSFMNFWLVVYMPLPVFLTDLAPQFLKFVHPLFLSDDFTQVFRLVCLVVLPDSASIVRYCMQYCDISLCPASMSILSPSALFIFTKGGCVAHSSYALLPFQSFFVKCLHISAQTFQC